MVRRALFAGYWVPLAGLLALVVGLFLAAIALGPVAVPLGDVLASFRLPLEDPLRVIVVEIRLPRALLGLLIGFSLGVSGAALQGLLRNPLAEPGLFGAPQSAAFVVVASAVLGFGTVLSPFLPLLAMAGAFLSVLALLAIAGRGASIVVLLLTGLALSALAGAGTALALNLAPNPFAALELSFWLMGSLEDRAMTHVAMAAPFLLPGCALLLAQGPALRLLTLGEDVARSLGLELFQVQIRVVTGVALCVGAGVAVAGAIGFVGLVAPHLVRRFFGADPGRILLPAGLAGAAMLQGADLLVRLVPALADVKLGVLTALVGLPFFLHKIMQERRALAERGL